MHLWTDKNGFADAEPVTAVVVAEAENNSNT